MIERRCIDCLGPLNPARLRHRSGREGGIWIQLCLSCAKKLNTVYHHERNDNERASEKNKPEKINL